ncbi:uncharacterized protein N7518_007462 [Penicillium psychrosexuale]|uniref:uncharacterized protein n=1 Tax=Penicillium psychrosexuale TaxID=1002107 RepID=UPI0025451D70|nr:uncharacterized protein N7518_007462 [Penicillium psychrosexuale]KAJ5790451.1 hypothetical protein N7518_007462 [Penicillium psychrosexuale]
MTANLHTHAKSGTLNLKNIVQFLIQVEVNDEDSYGDTALDLAIRNGHVGAVKLLLQNDADANRVSSDGKTPLYAATQAPNSGRIVELLLKHGAKPDEPVSQQKGDTPLMSAIRLGTSPEAIRALIQAGAAMDRPNDLGETPASLAAKSTNTAVTKAIRPKDDKPAWKPELENLLVSSGLFALAYFKNFKDVGINAIHRVAALAEPLPGQITYPRTVEEFKSNLHDLINKKGLEDFYPAGNEYVAKIAENSFKILNDSTIPGATPKNVTIMSRLALYQPILYCDDSGSMDTDNRMSLQASMVEKMARLITAAATEDKRLVHLRFINKDVKFDNLNPSELSFKMNFSPAGSTRLGSNLKDKVLDDFLYGPINKGDVLSRPLLILTVTDGAPNSEDPDAYQNEVRASLDFVKANGYGEEAVRYDLSQVGNAPEATAFLESWEMNDLVPNNINVTAEHLDAQFENLRDNEADLHDWLLERLNALVAY